jgi:hypothetical protein
MHPIPRGHWRELVSMAPILLGVGMGMGYAALLFYSELHFSGVASLCAKTPV